MTLPLEINAARSRCSGAEIAVDETADGVLPKPIRSMPNATLEMVVGALHRQGRAKTLEQMDSAVQREVRRRHKLGRS